MTTIKRILAATDFSQLGNSAVQRAILLAAREDAELLILHAIPRLSALEAAFGTGDDMQARMRAAAEANLDALAGAGRSAGVRCLHANIAEGDDYRAVAAATGTFGPDLVAIGAHGKGALQQFFLGGTASRILARTECPVLVVRCAPEGDYQQVLAAVNLGPRSDAVLRAAQTVAGQGRISIVHAYQAPFEAKLRYKGFSDGDIARYAEIEAQEAGRRLAALLAETELAGRARVSRIIHGHPNPVLTDVAQELGADLIIVGKHGGSRLEETVMGSISRFLAYYAPCDVLVV